MRAHSCVCSQPPSKTHQHPKEPKNATFFSILSSIASPRPRTPHPSHKYTLVHINNENRRQRCERLYHSCKQRTYTYPGGKGDQGNHLNNARRVATAARQDYTKAKVEKNIPVYHTRKSGNLNTPPRSRPPSQYSER